MTLVENNLALQIIKENYGDLAKTLCSYLIKKKSYPLVMLADDLNLDKKIVSQVFSILIIHNIVEYRVNARKIVEYRVNVKNTLNILKTTR